MLQRWTILAALLAATTVISADELTINGLPYPDVRITGVEDCEIVFQLASRRGTESLAHVDFIQLDREDDFNQAETLMAQGEVTEALELYRRARAADRQWVQNLAEFRRMWAMDQDARIDEAVKMWLKVIDDNDASPNARAMAPTNLAEAGDQANQLAYDMLEERREQAGEDDELWKAIIDLQLAIAEHQGDDAEAERLASLLLERSHGTNGGTTTSSDQVAASLQGAVVLVSNPDKAAEVMEIITADLYRYTEGQLPTALLALGKAQLILAEAGEGEERRSLLTDAGNNLMYVVVFFGESDQAPEAYYLAGRANELLGNTQAAQKAYEVVIADHAQSPFAAQARESMDAMNAE